MRPCPIAVGVGTKPGALADGATPAAIGSSLDPEPGDGGDKRSDPSRSGAGGPTRFGPNALGVGVGVAVGVGAGRRPASLPGSLGGRNAGVGVGVAVGWLSASLRGSLGGRNAGVGVGVAVADGTGTISRGGPKRLLPGGST